MRLFTQLNLIQLLSLCSLCAANTVLAGTDLRQAPTAAATESGCTWHQLFNPAGINFAYPDIQSAYYTAIVPPPKSGQTYVISGEVANVRYFSLGSYQSNSSPYDTLNDFQIAPNNGAATPFLGPAEVDRSIPYGAPYAVTMSYGPIPTSRDPNTLYVTESLADGSAILIYRTYVPLDGSDSSGGVPVPTINVVSGDQTQPLNPHAECPPVQDWLVSVTGRDTAYEVRNLQGWPPITGVTPRVKIISNPPEFQVYYDLATFFNAYDHYQHNRTNDLFALLANPELAQIISGSASSNDDGGGLFATLSTTYAAAPFSRDYADVYMVRAKAPVAVDSGSTSAQIRYWSACDYKGYATAVVACTYDKQTLLDADGFFTIVVSDAPDRPLWANAQNLMNWLPWGFERTSTMIVRDLLPASDFAQAYQNVPQGTNPYSISGAYFPIGTYCSSSAVQHMPVGLSPAEMFKYCAADQPNRYRDPQH